MGYVVRDLPWTIDKLRAIPPFEFENWAVIALGGISNKAQVGDMGINGRIFAAGGGRAFRSRDSPVESSGHVDTKEVIVRLMDQQMLWRLEA